MKLSAHRIARRSVPTRVGPTLILLAALLSQSGCQALTPVEEQALDEYRHTNVGKGGSM
jgi:hypothetical protein